MYDVIEPAATGSDRLPKKLEAYAAVILGDVTDMDDAFIALIDDYVRNGGKILATGFTSTKDGIGNPTNKIRLQSLGAGNTFEMYMQAKSTYLKVAAECKAALGNATFADFDLVMMYSGFLKIKPAGTAKSHLKLIPQTMFGPPEKAYYTNQEITDFPGLISNEYGKGKTVYLPWLIGSQYHFKGHYAYKILFVAALKQLLGVKPSITTNASPLIEMTRLANRNGAFEWVGLLNHSGQIGASILEPVPLYNTTLNFKPLKPVKEIRGLRSGKLLPLAKQNGSISCTIPVINDFEMIVCLYRH